MEFMASPKYFSPIKRKMHAAGRIPEGDRIPFLQKFMFGAGSGMDYLAAGLTVNILWIPFFNIGYGINPAILGLILMIFRGWDAITDPIMGNITDNARTRWGRRRPFMVFGALSTAAIYPFLWRLPEGMSDTGKYVYLILFGLIFFTFFTTWSMPYYGMQLELTPNYDERTRLTAWITFFGKTASIAGGWVLALIAGSWFSNPETGQPDIVRGMQACSWYIAGLIACVGLLPPIFVRERYYKKEVVRQPRDPFWQSIRESYQCRPLRYLIGISFILVLGNASVSGLWQYVNIYYIYDGRLAEAAILSGWKATIIAVVGVAGIPLWAWLSEIYDKKYIVGCMLVVTVGGHLLNIVCLRSDMPYLQLVPAIFESAAISSVWLFLPSMKADVADYDELNTYRRREGALNAYYSWFIKAAITCAVGLGGFVLHFTGFNVKLPEQPVEVLHRMVILYISLPVLIWSFTLVFLWMYPLNRLRMTEIRAELENRRGEL
jgi:glycoside/pentoside/hexuronide:cation symporter, GPH family